MNLFEANDKLYDLVEANHNLLPVINRFGIRPGFKDKTVEEICIDRKIDKDFFLALLNTYNNPDYFPETELMGFSPLLIIDYLKKTHEYYHRYFIPRLEILLEKLIAGCEGNSKDLRMIRNFYDKYKDEFLNHIRDEEENVFPIIERMVENPNQVSAVQLTQSVENEHSTMEFELNDLKNLLIRYLEPAYNDNDFNEFVAALYQFEKDMADHSRIENKILIARILKLAKG